MTIIVPEKLANISYLDILDKVKDHPWVKMAIKDGRECTSCGVIKRSDDESEVVVNFE